jgi:hypothetical protein
MGCFDNNFVEKANFAHNIQTPMKSNAAILILIIFTKAIAAQDAPPDGKPGSCYAKCKTPDIYSEISGPTYPVYIGSYYDGDTLIAELQFSTKNGDSLWIKNENGYRLLEPEVGDSVIRIYVVTDTVRLGKFKMKILGTRELLTRGGQFEWREVLCDEKWTAQIDRQLLRSLCDTAGFRYDCPWCFAPVFQCMKASLIKFQQQNALPIGNLDFQTLTALGIRY